MPDYIKEAQNSEKFEDEPIDAIQSEDDKDEKLLKNVYEFKHEYKVASKDIGIIDKVVDDVLLGMYKLNE